MTRDGLLAGDCMTAHMTSEIYDVLLCACATCDVCDQPLSSVCRSPVCDKLVINYGCNSMSTTINYEVFGLADAHVHLLQDDWRVLRGRAGNADAGRLPLNVFGLADAHVPLSNQVTYSCPLRF